MALPIAAPIAASAGKALAGVLSSLNPFDSSGPDKDKWEYRRQNINAAISQAQLGNVNAFWALGAYGQRQPNPKNWDRRLVPGMVADSDPGKGVDYIFGAGWTSREWGKEYADLVNAARQAYDALTPKFTASATGVSAGPGVFQIPTVPNIGNGTFANNDASSNPAGVIPGTQDLPSGLTSDSGPFISYTAGVSAWVVPIAIGAIVGGLLIFRPRRTRR